MSPTTGILPVVETDRVKKYLVQSLYGAYRQEHYLFLAFLRVVTLVVRPEAIWDSRTFSIS